MKFCSQCGASVTYRMAPDEDRERHVCDACDTVHYINPKVIVGCLPTVGEKILMCRRAIEPRYGKWTLPAGFMENGETSADGAARETLEEAAAIATNMTLYRIFDVPQSVRFICFIAAGSKTRIWIGPESLESALFSEEEIPWDELAFPTVRELLREFLQDRQVGEYPVRNTVIDYPRR